MGAGGAGYYAFTAVLAVAGYDQQRKAAKEQKKAQKAQQRMAEAKNRNERRKQIREQLMVAANQNARAVATGQSSTQVASGTLGNIFSAGTQAAQNIGFINETEDLGAAASVANQRAADHLTTASIFQSGSNLVAMKAT